MGGEDYLEGVSIFDSIKGAPHRHLISFGVSELYYDPQSAQEEFSGWGFEFSMRVAPFADDPDSKSGDGSVVPHEPFWAISLMQNLAKYVYNSKKWFEAYHFIPTNSPLRLNTDTKLVGVAFAPDPVLGGIDTPNGIVEFLQMVAITQRELGWLREDPSVGRVERLINMMRKDNPLLITDLNRTKEYV
nr:suppressor of fused domain protein [uncultured Campylobacter sp.]